MVFCKDQINYEEDLIIAKSDFLDLKHNCNFSIEIVQ